MIRLQEWMGADKDRRWCLRPSYGANKDIVCEVQFLVANIKVTLYGSGPTVDEAITRALEQFHDQADSHAKDQRH